MRDRSHQQGEDQAEALTADDRDGDCRALGRAGAQAESGRNQAGDDRKRGHQDGSQPDVVCPDDCLAQGRPLVAQFVRVVNLQDPVLLHNPEEEQYSESAPQVQGPPG